MASKNKSTTLTSIGLCILKHLPQLLHYDVQKISLLEVEFVDWYSFKQVSHGNFACLKGAQLPTWT